MVELKKKSFFFLYTRQQLPGCHICAGQRSEAAQGLWGARGGLLPSDSTTPDNISAALGCVTVKPNSTLEVSCFSVLVQKSKEIRLCFVCHLSLPLVLFIQAFLVCDCIFMWNSSRRKQSSFWFLFYAPVCVYLHLSVAYKTLCLDPARN